MTQAPQSWFRRTKFLDKKMNMNAQQTLTTTNQFKATGMALPCVLNTWPNGVVACTLPKRL
jgi:hypothetical protein